MTLSEIANKVIELAAKVRAYYEAEYPKLHPNYPILGPGEESPPPPPEEKELREFLTSLSVETLHQLLLIMYLGRTDFGTDEMSAYYEELRDSPGDAEQLAARMMYHAPLADYLLDGLEELRKHKINVDKLPLKKAKARKR